MSYLMSAKDRLKLFEKKAPSETKKPGGAGPKKIGKLKVEPPKEEKSEIQEKKLKKVVKKKSDTKIEDKSKNEEQSKEVKEGSSDKSLEENREQDQPQSASEKTKKVGSPEKQKVDNKKDPSSDKQQAAAKQASKIDSEQDQALAGNSEDTSSKIKADKVENKENKAKTKIDNKTNIKDDIKTKSDKKDSVSEENKIKQENKNIKEDKDTEDKAKLTKNKPKSGIANKFGNKFGEKKEAKPPAKQEVEAKKEVEKKKEIKQKKDVEQKKEVEPKKGVEQKKEVLAKKEDEITKEVQQRKEVEPKKRVEAKKEVETKKEVATRKESEGKKEVAAKEEVDRPSVQKKIDTDKSKQKEQVAKSDKPETIKSDETANRSSNDKESVKPTTGKENISSNQQETTAIREDIKTSSNKLKTESPEQTTESTENKKPVATEDNSTQKALEGEQKSETQPVPQTEIKDKKIVQEVVVPEQAVNHESEDNKTKAITSDTEQQPDKKGHENDQILTEQKSESVPEIKQDKAPKEDSKSPDNVSVSKTEDEVKVDPKTLVVEHSPEKPTEESIAVSETEEPKDIIITEANTDVSSSGTKSSEPLVQKQATKMADTKQTAEILADNIMKDVKEEIKNVEEEKVIMVCTEKKVTGDISLSLKDEDLNLDAELEANINIASPVEEELSFQPVEPTKDKSAEVKQLEQNVEEGSIDAEKSVKEITKAPPMSEQQETKPILTGKADVVPTTQEIDEKENIKPVEEEAAEVEESPIIPLKKEQNLASETPSLKESQNIPASATAHPKYRAPQKFKSIPEEFYDTLFYFSGMGTVVGSALSKGVYVPQRATKTALDVECIEDYEAGKDEEIKQDTHCIRTARHQAVDLSDELKKLQGLLGGLPNFVDSTAANMKVVGSVGASPYAFQPIGKPRRMVEPLDLSHVDNRKKYRPPGVDLISQRAEAVAKTHQDLPKPEPLKPEPVKPVPVTEHKPSLEAEIATKVISQAVEAPAPQMIAPPPPPPPPQKRLSPQPVNLANQENLPSALSNGIMDGPADVSKSHSGSMPLAPIENQPAQGGVRPYGVHTADPNTAVPHTPWQERYGSKSVEDSHKIKPFMQGGEIPGGLKPWQLSRLRGFEAKGYQFAHETPKSGADYSDSFYHGEITLENMESYAPYLVSGRSQSVDRQKKVVESYNPAESGIYKKHFYNSQGEKLDSMPYCDL